MEAVAEVETNEQLKKLMINIKNEDKKSKQMMAMPGDEERRAKALYRKKQQLEKSEQRKAKLLEQERNEAQFRDTSLVLIYPLLSYETEFIIQDRY